MITSAEEYNALLYKIQDQNAPSLAVLLPSDEKIYSIDLDSRTIEAPEYISVEADHMAETIWFKCARYYDNIDLSNTVCLVEYINADGTPYIWAVPFYDVVSLSAHDPDTGIEEPQMLFPWVIEQSATRTPGDIKFSMRFYKLDDSGTYLVYNLNLLPNQTTVLKGIDSDVNAGHVVEYDDEGRPIRSTNAFLGTEATNTLAIYAETVLQHLKDASDIGVYWIKL